MCNSLKACVSTTEGFYGSQEESTPTPKSLVGPAVPARNAAGTAGPTTGAETSWNPYDSPSPVWGCRGAGQAAARGRAPARPDGPPPQPSLSRREGDRIKLH